MRAGGIDNGTLSRMRESVFAFGMSQSSALMLC